MNNPHYDSRLEPRFRPLDPDEIEEKIAERYEEYLNTLWKDDPLMVLNLLNGVHLQEVKEDIITKLREQTEGGKNDPDFAKTYTSEEVSYEES